MTSSTWDLPVNSSHSDGTHKSSLARSGGKNSRAQTPASARDDDVEEELAALDEVAEEDEGLGEDDDVLTEDEDEDDEEDEDVPQKGKRLSKEERAEKKRQEKLKKQEERRKQREERQRQLDALEKQNQEIAADDAERAKARFELLMRQSEEIINHFISPEAQQAAEKSAAGGRKHRLTEKQEDEAMLKAATAKGKRVKGTRLFEQPSEGGTLKNYQMEGLNWLIRLYESGINGVLADEMGLGKTIQSIAMLAFLKEYYGYTGPFLVIGPKSTLANWMKELTKWTPCLRAVRFQGSKEERAAMIENDLQPGKFDVCVSSYEAIIRERAHLKKFHWRYFVIDEAHRIKNENSKLSQVVRMFKSHARLLLTGTPLQNNLRELWALLNFLVPEQFGDAEQFNAWFKTSEAADKQTREEEQQKAVARLHKLLKPFLLRRLKSEVTKELPPKKETIVYTGLSQMQRELYRSLLKKDIDAINGTGGDRVRLLNIIMQLRKACNHPYLFEGQEPMFDGKYVDGEHIIENAGKMVVLDKLLQRLHERGHRVLIFSQMTRILDILEDYLRYRSMEYCRIDGSTAGEVRDDMIESFNAPNSSKFVFLLSTRAGGLGINLATADTVILYDSDWNPQMDVQAMDRAHRIGQTRPVNVYRFITADTVEVRMLERATRKLYLDAVVIQQGRLADANKAASKTELLDMIRFGAEQVYRSNESTISDENIEKLLERGEKATQELHDKFSETKENALRDFSLDGSESAGLQDTFVFEGEDYTDARKKSGGGFFLDLGQRERKRRVNMNVDQYYKDMGAMQSKTIRNKKTPNLPAMHDYQFWPRQRLNELHEKEMLWYEEQQKKKPEDEEDETVNGLSPEEVDEKQKLEETAFKNWKKSEFVAFCRACAEYGRDNIEAIAEELPEKDEIEVRQYSKVFWDRCEELNDWPRIRDRIEKGEAKIRRRKEIERVLATAIAECPLNPWQNLSIKYTPGSRGKQYSEEEDRYLICMTHQLGYGKWDELKMEIRNSWEFRFDWFLKSRTPSELGRRVDVLLRLLEKEKSKSKESDKKRKNATGSAQKEKKKKA